MPIDNDSGVLWDILFDGSPSAEMKVEPAVKIRGVVWFGRGVSSWEVSS